MKFMTSFFNKCNILGLQLQLELWKCQNKNCASVTFGTLCKGGDWGVPPQAGFCNMEKPCALYRKPLTADAIILKAALL